MGPTHSKVKIFAWRACVNALPTNENLSNRKQSLVYVRWEDQARASCAEMVCFFFLAGHVFRCSSFRQVLDCAGDNILAWF